jgi:hypothetical protein
MVFLEDNEGCAKIMLTLSWTRVGLPLRAESEVDPLLSACEKVVSMGCRQEVRDSVRLESDPEASEFRASFGGDVALAGATFEVIPSAQYVQWN